MATIKEQFELNTENVNLATELLKVLSDRAGQYVWKRVVTKTTEVSVTNPSFSIVGDNNTGWTITEASFDHTQVTLDFFDGFTSSDGRIVFAKNSGKVQLKAVGYQGTSLTYNPSTGFFQNNTPSSDGTFTVSYTGTKTYTTETEIVDYVVADDESAYPDGAVQDGYWYELVEEGLTPEMLGFTKMAIDKFTFSTRTAGNTPLNHSLAELPKFYILMSENNSTTDYDIISASGECGYTGTSTSSYSSTGATRFVRAATPDKVGKGTGGSTTNSDTIIIGESVSKFTAGIEYTLITMA